jgi:hypothetical protein
LRHPTASKVSVTDVPTVKPVIKMELNVACPEVVETVVVPFRVPAEVVTVTWTPEVFRLFEDVSLSCITAG